MISSGTTVHLDIAITEEAAALLTCVTIMREFVWGTAEDEPLWFLDGHVFGRIYPHGWVGAGPWLAAASSDLTVVSMCPMLTLPAGVSQPPAPQLADALGRVLAVSDTWFLWSENFDERPPTLLELSAVEVSRRVRAGLENKAAALDLIAYSPSAAARLPTWLPLTR
ncbi:Hypothetical protein A7982_04274 [Minicystis rosea]|nr:Hypothetical protein A7982_04274 [Minicystis rosea]